MDDNKKIRSPIFFTEKGKYRKKPIYNIENNINGTTRFAITKLTDGGKWCRGADTLYYSINGVEIYTSTSNIIFVNLDTNTLWIKDYEKAISEVNPTAPEEKEYVILYVDIGYEDDTEEFPLRWESVIGRMTAYDNIKINAPVIDIDKSLVLVENVPLKDALTVRQFMDYLKNSDIVKDESFEIGDFAGSDYV